ncbi:MAG: Spore coat polysaccharide biosynthesis protein SpsE [Pelotomaculum sp. PtaB.Bin104]|nr:MAG: Spore coat polysaccharide biosynthesis protein SpsE [Pelotomaculum sp. PtaB.Bin104]
MFIYLEKARKCEEDARIVMDWRNNPAALKMFFHSEPQNWDDFYQEFRSEYFNNPRLQPVFAYVNGEKAGFLRFNEYHDIPGKTVSIGINLNPQMRGSGFGNNIIKKGTCHLFNQGYDTVVAEIKQNNIASIIAFEKAGFRYFDQIDKKIEDTGETIPIFRYIVKNITNNTTINSASNVFIIAEAGSNWRCGAYKRDLQMAKALIDVAVEAGSDAVKFQTFRAETVYVPNAGESDYLSNAGIKESITDIFRDLSMPYDMIPELAGYCQENGIQFMSTPFSVADAKAVDPYVNIHKIASYEITHMRLLEFIARTGKPLILSSGGATIEDIEWAVNHFYKNGGKNISIMQCTAKYPAPLSSLNLKAIPLLIERLNVPVGLSDHSREPLIGPVAAVALGATIIEKHFTLHNNLPGPDHSFAVTPGELKQMVKAIRQTEQSLGSGVKKVLEEEQELNNFAQRSIQAIKDIKKGEILSENINIDILRPGKQKSGLHPKYLPDIEGKTASREILAGEGIQADDYQ